VVNIVFDLERFVCHFGLDRSQTLLCFVFAQIFFLFFLSLSVVSYILVGIFWKKKDKSRDGSSIISPAAGDDDDSLVYRIWFVHL